MAGREAHQYPALLLARARLQFRPARRPAMVDRHEPGRGSGMKSNVVSTASFFVLVLISVLALAAAVAADWRPFERTTPGLRADAESNRFALPDAVLGRVFALYTDPWPKKRHHRRRFITVDTAETLVRLMKDDAQLRLASDHMGYVGWMLEHLSGHPGLQWQARSKRDWTKPPSDWVETRYEKKAKEKGLGPAYLCFTRVARGEDEAASALKNH